MRLAIAILVLVGGLWQAAEARDRSVNLRDKPANPRAVCNCVGDTGPGGPCYDAPGGRAYSGPGGPAYRGPGGPCAPNGSYGLQQDPTYSDADRRSTGRRPPGDSGSSGYSDYTRSPYAFPQRPGEVYLGPQDRCGTLTCFRR